jgi:hypothetical protein
MTGASRYEINILRAMNSPSGIFFCNGFLSYVQLEYSGIQGNAISEYLLGSFTRAEI